MTREMRRGGNGARKGARERGREWGVGAWELGCRVGLVTSDQRENVGPGRNVFAQEGGDAKVTAGCLEGEPGRSQDGGKGTDNGPDRKREDQGSMSGEGGQADEEERPEMTSSGAGSELEVPKPEMQIRPECQQWGRPCCQ